MGRIIFKGKVVDLEEYFPEVFDRLAKSMNFYGATTRGKLYWPEVRLLDLILSLNIPLLEACRKVGDYHLRKIMERTELRIKAYLINRTS